VTDTPQLDALDGTAIARAATGFVWALRNAGLVVPLHSAIQYVSALEAIGFERGYWAGRTTLVHRPEDIELYDRVFVAYWKQSGFEARPDTPVEHVTLAIDDESGAPPPDGAEQDDNPTITVRYSASEILRNKDFAECSDDELAEARRLMAQLRVVGSPRRSRRMVRSKRMRGRPDLRRTVRYALRAEGEPIKRAYVETGERPRRLVLLLDVSGSMESYARALIRFVHAAVVGRTKVEAFTLGTRLTRITRELSSRDPDDALGRTAAAVEDWSGGTRLGDGLREFNDNWGVRGMARGAVVVILSDGWDRGEPSVMAEQMQRLQRVAFRVIWVNPLKASPGYAPLAQGMAAAMPFIDEFVEGHSVESLEQLAALIAA
jgi:uncharacterized protein with von Willebrand factor type A (vWA) domain